MNLGISVTKSDVQLSMKKASKYVEATIRGHDATSYSKISKSDLENLKSELLKCISELNPNGERISSIVVSFPVAFTFMELLDLKKLFQAMGIEVNRYIDHGMASGLVAASIEPKDFAGYVCCAEHSDNYTELSLLCINDGVVEAIQNTTHSVDEEPDSKTICDQLDAWKNDYDLQTLYCQATETWLCACDFVEKGELEVKAILDEYATSRGALLQAEILNGCEATLLPVEISQNSILCIINGEDGIELLQPNVTIPTVHSVEVSTISPDWTEIELVSINNSTREKTSVFKTMFASLPEKRTVRMSVNINSNKAVSIVIDTEGSHIELNY